MAQLSTEGLQSDTFEIKTKEQLALIPLRDLVIFPKTITPVMVKRSKSRKALDFAMRHGRRAVFVVQKDKEKEDPKPEDLYKVGTVSKIRQTLKAPDGSIRILVEGMTRAKIETFIQLDPFIKVRVNPLIEAKIPMTQKMEALMQSVLNLFQQSVALGAMVPLDIMLAILNIRDPNQLTSLIVTNMDFKTKEKQQVLEAMTLREKMQRLSEALVRNIKTLEMARKLQTQTQKELGKMQKEVFLREQLKSIEKELGILGGRSEIDELKEKIKKAKMPKKVEEVAMKELKRFEKMPSFSPEVSWVRTYLDWLIEMPWSKKIESKLDIKKAKKILDDDHYGLEKAKERVLEYLAVQKLVGKIRGPILCFAGPPGTGKTSIGKSIARALGRKFVRMSLGGIRDEAEIRGHRRTYVGALPGRIIQGIKTAGTKNPVFMLDEIDKVGADFRGDPSAALLEALDPEQNFAFSDHYLEVPFDLSDVMFITTANIIDTIPPALRDRMEVIDFPGYIEDEKFHIAKQFLIPKQLKANGLEAKTLIFTEPAVRIIIREYTMEAGVRELERQIAAVCRKVAKNIASNGKKSYKVAINDLRKYLGPAKYFITMAEKKDEIGVATGLAWTTAGGDILHIEATRMPGKGNLILTGHLGKVMRESAQAAFSYARARAKKLKVKEKFYKDEDLHVHVPAGAIPKDGPSAGIAMASALVSVLTQKPLKRKIGMTGEITLRGKVLEIGGVKEKVLAAHRAGVKEVILPLNNKKDLIDIPAKVKKELKFIFVTHMDQVLKEVLKKS